ncbi:MAG: hypothetical protein ACRCYZ_04520 [Alphaproteobacteria bacterium]
MKLNRFLLALLPFCLNASIVNFSTALPINPSFYDENVWKRLKNRVEGNIIHTEEVCDALKKLFQDSPNTNLSQAERISQKNISELQILMDNLEETKQNPDLLERTIQNLLSMRLDNLRLRKEKMEFIKKEQASPGNDKLYLQGRTHPERYEDLWEEEKIMSRLSTDVYQTQVEAILTLLSFTNMRELLYKTKCWIACSSTLWDRMRGLDTDLGHPDEAILDVADNFYKGLDLDLMEAYLHPSCPYVTHDYSTFYKSSYKTNTYWTPFEYQDMTGRPYGSNARLPELEIPDFLKKLPPIQQPSLQPESAVQITKIKQKPVKKVVVLAEQKVFVPEPATGGDPGVEINTNPPVADKAIKTHVDMVDATPVKKPEKPLAFAAAPVTLPPSQKTPLKGKLSKTHEAIFNVSRSQKVSFGEFKTLWEHLGGEIPNNRSGGSHRAIKWQGKIIGGTFVPHGGGTYGPRSINALQEALAEIGYGKEH